MGTAETRGSLPSPAMVTAICRQGRAGDLAAIRLIVWNWKNIAFNSCYRGKMLPSFLEPGRTGKGAHIAIAAARKLDAAL